MTSYLQTEVPAPLPYHLQLDWLVVASFPQLQPHFVIDIKQVMGVIPGITEHFFWQRARVPTEDMALLTSNPTCLFSGCRNFLGPF
jgi:hypothetical protein